MSTQSTDFLILGGGPTGLGAALRLEEHGREWHLLEAADHFGGLASSWVDNRGFTWDLGGHVQFSHYETFDRYMNAALGYDGWIEHQRESWIWFRDRFVPYPFQNNLHRLDPLDRWRCLEGLLHQSPHFLNPDKRTPNGDKCANFGEWIRATFGAGIAELFMEPYNRKVWACSPDEMDFGWIGERVAVPDLYNVLRSICTETDNVSWGPNATFRFPKHGGTGSIWSALGTSLTRLRTHLGTRVVEIRPQERIVLTNRGETWKYRHLISTIPLNQLITIAKGVVPADVGKHLRYSSTTVIGVGLPGKVPERLSTKCWMYFPEDNSPYYRVTVFSNYSPYNVAKPDEQWSLMAEIASPSNQAYDPEMSAEKTLRAFVQDKLIDPDMEPISVVWKHLPQGYPVPFLNRDSIVDPILRAFEQVNIFSRGRFGAWKYEVSNQDHSFAQGYECVERCINSGGLDLEPTLTRPGFVNNQRNR